MLLTRRRTLAFEKVPVDAAESYLVRQFRWPNFPFLWHYHPEIELTWIVRGRGLRYVGDSVEAYGPGDLCLLGSNLPHTWYSDRRDGRVHSVVLQFMPDFWGAAFAALPEMRRIDQLCRNAKRGLVIAGPACRRVQDLLAQLLTQKSPSVFRLSLLLEMLGHIERNQRNHPLTLAGLEPVRDQRSNAQLAKVLDHLHRQDTDLPSQSAMARFAALSPPGFARFFKRCMGKTYVAYVNELRVGRACRNLIETNRSIAAIAYAAGFSNLANFNRRFKRIKGVAPRVYRRMAQVH